MSGLDRAGVQVPIILWQQVDVVEYEALKILKNEKNEFLGII